MEAAGWDLALLRPTLALFTRFGETVLSDERMTLTSFSPLLVSTECANHLKRPALSTQGFWDH